ncbi:MAG: hypothetical protein DMD69_00520 [Gemmatimonadetes bacterium]|nr:MAG: hypothetical protein DMD69_00520 [Gemmatimonadota bacterium]PYP23578.1 MAG: hypothetical protein DMD55_16720 [Gemmatimonadota bacterium]
MHYSVSRLGSAALIALSACATDTVPAPTVPPPTFHYPDLLRAAGVQGRVDFQVTLDAVGSPQLTTLQILESPNPAFPVAVRNALKEWRDPGMAGRIVERSVLFVMMDTAATDSIARCRTRATDWVVCARRVSPRTIRDAAPVRTSR